MRNTAPSIGIDFGTTNSSVAVIRQGKMELLSFSSLQGLTESYRSVLYLEQHRQAARVQLKSFTGPQAIEHYLRAESPGRLIQSLKSYLTSRSLTGTEVFGRRYTLEELIARILTDLRLATERHIGEPVRHATVGRPVRFVSAETVEDDAFAVGRLEAAFKHAGFDSVDFEFEPIGAAYAYESTLKRDELILIGDFGGGTSDFSLLQRSEFEAWIADDLAAIEQTVDGLLDSTTIGAEKVDRVFLTGGTSFVPAVRRIFSDRFSSERVVIGGEFTSVAKGLALSAARTSL